MSKKIKYIKLIAYLGLLVFCAVVIFLTGLFIGRYRAITGFLEYNITYNLRTYESIRDGNIQKGRAQMAIGILSNHSQYAWLKESSSRILFAYAGVTEQARETMMNRIENLREEMMEDIEKGSSVGMITDTGQVVRVFPSETEKDDRPQLSEIVDVQPEVSPQFEEEWEVPGLEMHFVHVEPGEFQMGSEGEMAYDNENPVNNIKLTAPFWIGKYEVTQKQFERVMGYNRSSFEGEDRPVEMVAWDEAVEFCERLTEIEKQLGRLPAGYEFRLPSEAEWEYAARGGHKSKGYIYSGSNDPDDVAWHKGNSEEKTHGVGLKQPNELGIYDMSGNVREWCLDWYDDLYYERIPKENPVNLEQGGKRVVRGARWNLPPRRGRVSTRWKIAPDSKRFYLGFRVVLGPEMED